MVIINYIKKSYQYLFYKLYRFSEAMPHPWWSDVKASSIMDILCLITIFTLGGYYNIFIDRYIIVFPNKMTVIVISLIIIICNYYLFNYRGKWKKVVEDFDRLPKTKNKIGSWLVFLFICLVLGNLIYSFYLMSQIDWSQYR